jgi:uroporphyrinogen III methyltransferase/synthase
VAVGPKTAATIEAHGLKPDLVPEDFRAEGVVELLRQQGVAGRRILYPRAELARDLIPRQLSAAGATVAAPVAYRTLPPADGATRLRALLAEGIDAVTFTSSSTVENFLRMAGPEASSHLKGVTLVSIGPLTTATIERHGLKAAVEAQPSTLEGMVEAMIDYFRDDRSREPGFGKS